jgi:hypothetical protein
MGPSLCKIYYKLLGSQKTSPLFFLFAATKEKSGLQFTR